MKYFYVLFNFIKLLKMNQKFSVFKNHHLFKIYNVVENN